MRTFFKKVFNVIIKYIIWIVRNLMWRKLKLFQFNNIDIIYSIEQWYLVGCIASEYFRVLIVINFGLRSLCNKIFQNVRLKLPEYTIFTFFNVIIKRRIIIIGRKKKDIKCNY